jgi:hypothetical protein
MLRPLLTGLGRERDDRGRIRVNATGLTSVPDEWTTVSTSTSTGSTCDQAGSQPGVS